MKHRTPKRYFQNRYSVSMTPLIDCIFLLMIFFLLTINYQMSEGVLDNLLPQTGSQEGAEPPKDWETVRLRIKMTKEDGRMKVYLQERIVYTYEDLLYYLDQLPEDIQISIEPKDNVLYRYVIGVYNVCLKSKKKNIVFGITT